MNKSNGENRARWMLLNAVILLIAVIAAYVLKTKPELIFYLPNGYITWARMGGNMPPYFDQTPYELEEFKTWARDGDLIVTPACKSGTTWMLYCAHQIRVKGQDSDYREVNVNTPWVGYKHKPGQTWKELKGLMNTTILEDGSLLKDFWDHPDYPFRVFKSHFGPRQENGTSDDVLPVKEFPGVKYLAMVREGRDVVASFFPFFAKHRPEYKKIWGGFPPSYETKEQALKDLLPGGILYYLYFGYAKSWWRFRNEPNVLLMHYNDMRKDLRGGVKKIAKFVNVELNEKELDRVTEKCGFDHMKKIQDKFNYLLWGNENFKTQVMCGSHYCKGDQEGSVIQKGKVGSGKSFFTPEMERMWQDAIESEFSDPNLRRWAEHGGRFD